MSLENNKENNESNELNRYVKNNKENNEINKLNRYVKNSVDYNSYQSDKGKVKKYISFSNENKMKNNDSVHNGNILGDVSIFCENERDDFQDIDSCDSSVYIDLLEDFEIENPDELSIDFFNDFTLLNIGMHDFIREIYFED